MNVLAAVLVAVVATVFVTPPVSAQWLTRRTPGIPRTADGKPNLTAPAPRTADGHPDFTGLWAGAGGVGAWPDPTNVLPWAYETVLKRQDAFGKDHPAFKCLPTGPEPMSGFRRILQTPAMIAMLNENLTYRQIFMDGRELERDPHPTWMGYSVGRWEGDALVVDSVGFNDRTWLHIIGLPHTEALRVRERFVRRDLGHLDVEVTFTDPGAYTKPWSTRLDLRLVTDTEMLEAYCENSSDHWAGSWSDAQKSKVNVPAEILSKYVGVYSGLWAGMPRTVRFVMEAGELAVTIDGIRWQFPLVAHSDTQFMSAQGYVYDFVRTGAGPATQVVEHHVSGSYTFDRQR
jgi:hypothetical protein